MLHCLLKEPSLDPPAPAPPPPHPSPNPPNVIPKYPRNALNQLSCQANFRLICDHLVDITRRRNLPGGRALHAHVIKSGFGAVPLVCNNFINFYSKLQLPHSSEQIFHETPVKSSTTWSSIISCFSQNELPFRGLEYFKLMLKNKGMVPDDYIFPCATKSCAMVNDRRLGRSVHCLAIKIGFGLNVHVGSSVVDMYAKCGSLVDARKLFDQMPEKNVVTWSGMISGYTQMGEHEEAMRLFKDAFSEGLEYVNDFTYSSVIRVCGNLTLFELGRQIHALCLKTNYDRTSFVGSALISMYSKSGVIECAHRVFNEVSDKNLGLWNSMLIACAQHTHTENVFEYFKKMQNTGVRPNFITFLCMLYACSHAGRVNEGKRYFAMMREYGIEPGSQHYSSMVDLLARAGKLDEAMKVIDEMPMLPTESVWGALLTGCRIHKNTELASSVADRVFESGPVSPGLHMLLSNAYATAGRYQEAAKARKMLKDRGQKKETGLSWVEENNRVHTFSAGDRKHELCGEIYRKLKELGKDMEKAGYVVDMSHVSKEVDDEEKKLAIRFHSERLAIVFALITFPAGRPIRIMKNLRVCGDCHVAIKFMSKCTGRVITVRDNTRFHRFENGECSCGDYW
ncbi:Putative pentatricopeptide repeat-containing protein [Striga hermonthica]|uniref:Pentatricopeptide repeat-containing protein n=1 Tax=Striga hermonthica TaxID=68872 RepID=A0A9N7MP68_STRHE|nr:Putative pentatricopeptide repeat-containing protein [Striga hermonthica]